MYLENRWDRLLVFLGDGRVPMDSNAVERALRSSFLGRKNSLGSKSVRGIRATEIFHSLITSACLCALDPEDYLRTAIKRAVEKDRPLLPHELATLEA